MNVLNKLISNDFLIAQGLQIQFRSWPNIMFSFILWVMIFWQSCAIQIFPGIQISQNMYLSKKRFLFKRKFHKYFFHIGMPSLFESLNLTMKFPTGRKIDLNKFWSFIQCIIFSKASIINTLNTILNYDVDNSNGFDDPRNF